MTAIGVIQDPSDYSVERHGDLDTFDRVDGAQAKQAAVGAAVLALSLADRAQMPPKFDAGTMPVPLGPPPVTYSGTQ